uniref:NAD(P)-binding domain-containing protein n=2 Tax=Guillardia theta TaxID=55529 RepID=A0A7S4PRE2_GUITH|mmetsp:Transcript_9713/g.32497  ORF Transcript_9713/g.32497 Transcript_9713/m.32497 type:complete len:447 (+) Transcript_9713:122-1462(+)
MIFVKMSWSNILSFLCLAAIANSVHAFHQGGIVRALPSLRSFPTLSRKKKETLVSMRFEGGRVSLDRKEMLVLTGFGLAALTTPSFSGAEPNADFEDAVAVIGAGGYTGGDTVRSLIKKGQKVIACTRRPQKIVLNAERGPDTIVLDDERERNLVRSAIVDVNKASSIPSAIQGAKAVIFTAASRPKVTATVTPGTKVASSSSSSAPLQTFAAAKVAPPSDHVEDIGLENVAKACIANKIPRLVIVSSVCAKCRKKQEYDVPDQLDRGAASCDACYKKQAGEDAVRELYAAAKDPSLSYTIVRPGMLTLGEARGVKEVEFNQGVTKSGMISRLDLADILTAAALSKDADGKTFEVYYRDSAQPVDMYASLQSCKALGKSVKECFFGDGYDESTPVSLDEMLKNPVKGTLFASGRVVHGNSYFAMFKDLSSDKDEAFDLDSIGYNSM